MVSQVAGVADYHSNADEPSIFDYNVDFKNNPYCVSSTCTGVDPYASNEFRVSDHDPVIVGLNPVNQPPSADAGGPYTVVEGSSVTLNATGTDPEALQLPSNGTWITMERLKPPVKV